VGTAHHVARLIPSLSSSSRLHSARQQPYLHRHARPHVWVCSLEQLPMRCIKTSWSVWSVDTDHHGKSLVLRLGQLIRDQEQVLNPSASMFKTLCVVCSLEQVTMGCIWSVDTDHYGKSLVLRLGPLIRDQEQALKPTIMLKKEILIAASRACV
jgi:hypothetical protein